MKKIQINKIYLIYMLIIIIILFNGTQSHDNDFINALKNKDSKKLEKLIKSGIDLNLQDKNGWTYLHYAAVYSNSEIIELLVKNGAKLEIKNNNENTPLLESMLYSNKETLISLLNLGANISTKNNKGGFPLLYITNFEKNDWITLAKYLLEKGAKVNEKTNNGMTCLHFAIMGGNYDYVKFLLENKADPNARTFDDQLSPFICTAYITARFTDIDESNDKDQIIRDKIEKLIISYGAKKENIPNTIGLFGCLFTDIANIINTIINIENEKNNFQIPFKSLDELNKVEYFTYDKNKVGGVEAIITIENIKKMIEIETGKKVKITFFQDKKALEMLNNATKSDKLFFILGNVGCHPNIKQHWINVSNMYSDLVREKRLDYFEVYSLLETNEYKLNHLKTVILIELL